MPRWIATTVDGREHDAAAMFKGGVPGEVRELRQDGQEPRAALEAANRLLSRRDFAATHLRDTEVLVTVDPHRVRAWARAHGGEQVTVRLDARGCPVFETLRWAGKESLDLAVGGAGYGDWGRRMAENLEKLQGVTGVPRHRIFAEVLPDELPVAGKAAG
jgi:hypothetical protein